MPGGAELPVTIYHNPACGTSRKVLGLIRESGAEPRIVEYLKTPPTRTGHDEEVNNMADVPRTLGEHTVD